MLIGQPGPTDDVIFGFIDFYFTAQ